MTAKRSHRRLAAFLLLASLSGVAIAAGLDARPTAAIVMPERTDATGVTGLKTGLDALSGGDIDAARQQRDGLAAGTLDHDILAWAIALYGGDRVPSGEIAATDVLVELARKHRLRRRREKNEPRPAAATQSLGG